MSDAKTTELSYATGKSAVLCFSGGLDSTVLLYNLLEEGYDVYCLSVDYGQRHKEELNHAAEIVKTARNDYYSMNGSVPGTRRVGFHIVDLGPSVWRLFEGSSQTSPHIVVPEGHYTAVSMRATVVPNRNMVLLALAASYAISVGAKTVAYAAHAGDHTIYADCRPSFVLAMWNALYLCDEPDKAPVLYTPFVNVTKADIVRLGHDLGAPMSMTYSCYKGEKNHCGKCGTCVERREAFQLAGIPDGTLYD